MLASRPRTGSACKAGKPCRRVPATVGAPRRELPYGDTEDGGQAGYLLGSESALPTVAVTFGRAHGGGSRPAHQPAELYLCPPLKQAEGPDVRADNGELLRRDFIDAATPSGCHVPACQMTL
jgi:hypothetical protein